MPRARTIKPGFHKNEKLGALQPLARILFAGLWMDADKSGRVDGNLDRIKREWLPFDNCNIGALVFDLEESGFIRVQDGYLFLAESDAIAQEDPAQLTLRRRIHSAARRARLRDAFVEHVNYQEVYDKNGGFCFYCAHSITFAAAVFDHYIPLARGGKHERSNIRLSCRSCNAHKAAKVPGVDFSC